MPRQTNGSYLAPSGTTAVSGQVISSAFYNSLETDIGNEVTNSLDRLGRGGMQAALNMNNNKVSNIAPGVNGSDAATMAQISQSARLAATGGTDTMIASDTVIAWDYSFPGTKTQSLLAASSVNPGKTVIIKDLFGDAAINHIVLAPVSGSTIDGASTFTLNRAFQSVTLVAIPGSNVWIIT